MGNFENLKRAIQAVIKANGNQEITGQIMQDTLLSLISNVGKECTFVGVAEEKTIPGVPDGNVFYIANPGTYPNFNAAKVGEGELGVFLWRGEWKIFKLKAGGSPNNEDINFNSKGLLQFADKEYKGDNITGLGRKYLRKNIVGSVNELPQNALEKPNTTYYIKNDFDLKGREIKVGKGSVLKYEGGSLNNGTVVSDETEIQGIERGNAKLYGKYYRDGKRYSVTLKSVLKKKDFQFLFNIEVNKETLVSSLSESYEKGNLLGATGYILCLYLENGMDAKLAEILAALVNKRYINIEMLKFHFDIKKDSGTLAAMSIKFLKDYVKKIGNPKFVDMLNEQLYEIVNSKVKIKNLYDQAFAASPTSFFIASAEGWYNQYPPMTKGDFKINGVSLNWYPALTSGKIDENYVGNTSLLNVCAEAYGNKMRALADAAYELNYKGGIMITESGSNNFPSSLENPGNYEIPPVVGEDSFKKPVANRIFWETTLNVLFSHNIMLYSPWYIQYQTLEKIKELSNIFKKYIYE